MRHPILMEDEGRHHFIGLYPTKKAAEVAIRRESGLYFQGTDFYILVAEES